MKKAASRAKKHYDLCVRGSVPEVGDPVLVKLVGLTGKHKLADKWESELYKIIRKPDAGIPVYVVQHCDGSGAVVRCIGQEYAIRTGTALIQ